MKKSRRRGFLRGAFTFIILFLGMLGLSAHLSLRPAVAQDIPMVPIHLIQMPSMPVVGPTSVGNPDVWRPPQMVNIQMVEIRMVNPTQSTMMPMSLPMVQPMMITPQMINPCGFPAFSVNIGGYVSAPTSGLSNQLSTLSSPAVSPGFATTPTNTMQYNVPAIRPGHTLLIHPDRIAGAVSYATLSSNELKRQGFGETPVSLLEKAFVLEQEGASTKKRVSLR